MIVVGTDIVDIHKVAALWHRHTGRMVGSVYSVREIPETPGGAPDPVHLAMRFAAKEAAVKALGLAGVGGYELGDIEVQGTGSLRILLSGVPAERARRLGIELLWAGAGVSGGQAFAIVLGETRDAPHTG